MINIPVYYLTHLRVSIPYVDTDNGYSIESFVLYNIGYTVYTVLLLKLAKDPLKAVAILNILAVLTT
jgi:hypothetical protein